MTFRKVGSQLGVPLGLQWGLPGPEASGPRGLGGPGRRSPGTSGPGGPGAWEPRALGALLSSLFFSVAGAPSENPGFQPVCAGFLTTLQNSSLGAALVASAPSIPLASLTVSLCPWSSISQTTCLMTGSLIFLPFSPVSLLCLFRAPLSVRQQFSQQFSLRLPLVLFHGFLFHEARLARARGG